MPRSMMLATRIDFSTTPSAACILTVSVRPSSLSVRSNDSSGSASRPSLGTGIRSTALSNVSRACLSQLNVRSENLRSNTAATSSTDGEVGRLTCFTSSARCNFNSAISASFPSVPSLPSLPSLGTGIAFTAESTISARMGLTSSAVTDLPSFGAGINSAAALAIAPRSEEHTSELQSRGHLVYLHSFPTRRSSDLRCNFNSAISASFPSVPSLPSLPSLGTGIAFTAESTISARMGLTSSAVTDLPSFGAGINSAAALAIAPTSISGAAGAGASDRAFSSSAIRSTSGAVASRTMAAICLPNSTGSIMDGLSRCFQGLEHEKLGLQFPCLVFLWLRRRHRGGLGLGSREWVGLGIAPRQRLKAEVLLLHVYRVTALYRLEVHPAARLVGRHHALDGLAQHAELALGVHAP